MKVKMKPNGDSARRRAIQKVRDQFYFLYQNSKSERIVSRGPLWGIALAFFLLFQSCEEHTGNTHSSATPEFRVKSVREAGSLLLYSDNAAAPSFSHDYLTQGYKDDLYLRNRILNGESGAELRLSARTTSENAGRN